MTDLDGAPKEGEESPEGKRPAFKSIQAMGPITGMGLFIVATVALALVVGPLYDTYGLSSGFKEFAEDELWYLYAFGFVVMMVVMAVVILILRKLLRKRKLKLKYLFAFVVFTSTIVVLQPLIDTLANGAPPSWRDYDIDIENMERAYPLDPFDIGKGLIVYTDRSFHILQKGVYTYDELSKVDVEGTLFEPQFNWEFWIISAKINNDMNIWTVDLNGTLVERGHISSPIEGLEPAGANLFTIMNWSTENIDYLILSVWVNQTDWRMITSPMEDLTDYTDWTSRLNKSRGPYYPASGWTNGESKLRYSWGIRGFSFHHTENGTVIVHPSYQGHPDVEWLYMMGRDGLYYEQPPPLPNSTQPRPGILYYFWTPVWEEVIEHEEFGLEPTEVSFNFDGSSYDLLIIRGDRLYRDNNGTKEDEYYLSEVALAVFQEGYEGRIWLVFDGAVSTGYLEDTERNQLPIQALSIILAGLLVGLLLWKPKWWLVDLGGLLMGAGVIAIMGISFPIPFTILLLVLLAVYDFISVYKTKHMIALADSVVEAKMPILLVFPMKWSYRYEDETNLMDPKRKRESLFMGLGDVIIPGILILSAATFLSPVGGVRLLGFIYPPVGVALFTLLGMIVGWGSLMFFVLKGKAHAGLPPINTGTILGFIIGHMIIYGTLVFW